MIGEKTDMNAVRVPVTVLARPQQSSVRLLTGLRQDQWGNLSGFIHIFYSYEAGGLQVHTYSYRVIPVRPISLTGQWYMEINAFSPDLNGKPELT